MTDRREICIDGTHCRIGQSNFCFFFFFFFFTAVIADVVIECPPKKAAWETVWYVSLLNRQLQVVEHMSYPMFLSSRAGFKVVGDHRDDVRDEMIPSQIQPGSRCGSVASLPPDRKVELKHPHLPLEIPSLSPTPHSFQSDDDHDDNRGSWSPIAPWPPGHISTICLSAPLFPVQIFSSLEPYYPLVTNALPGQDTPPN